ncbi:MAG: hypothetical protein KC592_07725 [Nitrospira sp.]|nr:hypothetical protein [Nitrospira sp.]
MSEDQEKPKLRPVPKAVPEGEPSFWILDGKNLVVQVRNDGGNMTKGVKVKVDFRGFGRGGNPDNIIPQEKDLPKLEKNKSEKLKFDLPTPDALETDFRFIIIIDEKGKLANFTNVVIRKCDIASTKAPVKNDTSSTGT